MSSCILLHILFGIGGALIGWLLTSQYWQRIYNRRESVIVDRNRENRLLNDEISQLKKQAEARDSEMLGEIEQLRIQLAQRSTSTSATQVDMSASEVASEDPYLESMTQDELEGRDNPDDIYPLLQSETIQDYITALRELEEENSTISDSAKKHKKKYKSLRKKYNALLEEHTSLSTAYEKLDKKKDKKVVQQIAVKESIDMDKLMTLLQKNITTLTKKEIKNITVPEEKSTKKKK